MLLFLLACTDPTPPTPPLRPTLEVLPAPARPGDPAGSAARRPGWSNEMRAGYAPQVDDPAAALAAAQAAATGGEAEGGLLVCEAKAQQFDGIKLRFGPFETKNKADLRIYVSFGKWLDDDYTVGDGERNANVAIATAPLLWLESGQKVRVNVYDRDLLMDDHIVTLEAPFAGSWPLTMAADGAGASCWSLPRADVEARVRPQLAAVAEALAYQTESWHADLARDDLGETMRAPMPQPSLQSAAAWIGWDDPRVVAFLDTLTLLRERFDEERLSLLRATEPGLPVAGSEVGLDGAVTTATLLATRCGDVVFPNRSPAELEKSPLAPEQCSFVVRVSNNGPLELNLDPNFGAAPLNAAMLFDSAGHWTNLSFRGRVVNQKLVEEPGLLLPGESAVLVFAGDQPENDAWLLRAHAGSVEGQGRWVLLRVR